MQIVYKNVISLYMIEVMIKLENVFKGDGEKLEFSR